MQVGSKNADRNEMPISNQTNQSQRRMPGRLDDIDALVREHRSSVLRYVLSRVHDVDLAETVTQDCFLRAYDARNEFRGDCGVRTWLIAIAMNLVRDHTRTKRFRFWKEAHATAIPVSEIHDRVPTRQPTPEGDLLATEQIARMWGTVNSLPQKQRTVLLMRFKKDMKLSEIACATGMTLNTIKAHLYRGLQTVRTQTESLLPVERQYGSIARYLSQYDVKRYDMESSLRL